jgi:hypothetical protein
VHDAATAGSAGSPAVITTASRYACRTTAAASPRSDLFVGSPYRRPALTRGHELAGGRFVFGFAELRSRPHIDDIDALNP